MLLKKINHKDFKIGIIGLGYVGLPRALQFSEKKINVIGFDTDKNKIINLKKGNSYITNVNSKLLKKNIKNKKFFPTSKFNLIEKVDVIIICLPTPLKDKLKPDLSYIKNTFNKIKKHLKKNQLICLESTSYPETTREIFLEYLEKNFSLGKDFFLCYSPERNDPGLNIKLSTIPKIVSGYTKNCKNLINKIYRFIFKKTVILNSIELAEMTKIYENIYRAVNIGFVNEMKKICIKMNLDINEIINAAKTKPFGFKAFYPGPGLGGHCIPIDPFYLTWKAREYNLKTEFISLAGKVNKSMPRWIFKQVQKKITKKDCKKVLILGVAYKKNINDCRESPAFELIKILKDEKIKVDYSDPFIKKIPKLRNYNFENMKSILIKPSNLKKYDVVILVTDHDKFNYEMIEKNSKLIFDTRNIFKKKLSNINFA